MYWFSVIDLIITRTLTTTTTTNIAVPLTASVEQKGSPEQFF